MRAHAVEAGLEHAEREHAVLGPGERRGPQPSAAGDVQLAGPGDGDGRIDDDLPAAAHEAAVGDSGEGDRALLAHGAVPAVGADEEPGGQLVASPRAVHLGDHLAGGLAQRAQLMAPPDLHTQLARTLFEEFLQLPLGDGQHVHRVVLQRGQLQRQRAELEARHRRRRPVPAAEPLVQAALVQRRYDAADQAVGLGYRRRARAAARARPGVRRPGRAHRRAAARWGRRQ